VLAVRFHQLLLSAEWNIDEPADPCRYRPAAKRDDVDDESPGAESCPPRDADQRADSPGAGSACAMDAMQ
jgi:hypothetical protein